MSQKPAAAAPAAAEEIAQDARRRLDPSLHKAVQEGDAAAFERLYRRYHQEIYRYCMAILHRREDAEDALQATMMAALRSLPGEKREIAVRPWLFRVAHNEAISLIRKRRPVAEIDENAIAAVESAEASLAGRDRLRQLVTDLGALPERQCSALVMRELSGLRYAEIGTALNTTEGAARQTVFEARSALVDLAEGRAMECEDVRQLISERDGRRLRGRRIRSHLKGCDGCAAFAAAIGRRREDLEALSPPMPALAASAVLSGLLGGSGAAGVGIGGGGLVSAAALKGASVIAAGAIAVGAAAKTDVVDIPGIGGESSESEAGSGQENVATPGGEGDPADFPALTGGAEDGRSGDRESEGENGNGPGKSGQAPGQNGSRGKSGQAPGQNGNGPGKSGQAPGQNGSRGNSDQAPGQDGSSSGNSDQAPGQGGTAPVQSETTPGAGEPPGQAETTPGQAGAPPGQAPSPPAGSSNAGGNGKGSR